MAAHQSSAMDRLLTIKRVANYRALQGWSSTPDLLEFPKYNVIFGVNGTGKSTIASLLRNASVDGEWQSGMEIVVGNENENDKRTISDAGDLFWKSLRVFNNEYVQANLRFEGDTGGAAEPLLVLGEQRVGAEEERAAAMARLALIATELPAHEQARREAGRIHDKLATDTARVICEELQGVAQRYAARSYTARQVRQLIEAGVTAVDGIDVARELRTARTETLPELSLPLATMYASEEVIEAVRGALQEQALSVVIRDLADEPTWGRWVEAGVELHVNHQTCIFCGNKLSSDRRHALDAHFDESLKRLQRRVTELREQITTLRAECTRSLQNVPKSEQLTESLRDEYALALEAVKLAHAKFAQGLDALVADLDAKSDAMFSSLAVSAAPETTTLTLDGVTKVIERHNAYVKDIQNHRHEAAERVEHKRVSDVMQEYRDLDGRATSEAAAVQALKNERADLEEVLQRTEVAELDPLPMADRLTEDLSQLLGRDDLRFVADSRGYRIMREGSPASHLSEGERNAISLLYFLRSLEGHGTDRENCVVVIDDPVSSLDDNSLVGASALLWARLVTHCGQLIMFTHNFELFRTWSYQLTGAQSKIGRKSFGLYEMRSSVVATEAGGHRRVPAVLNWPYDYHMQKRLRSEYHYLFWTVLRTLTECRESPTPEKELEAAALLPNICRRLLEAFLAFRHPAGVGTLSEQVREIKPDLIEGEIRTRVLRFVHMYSHHEEANISRSLVRPETLENVRAVMEFMKAIDDDHFQNMCAALEVEYRPHSSALDLRELDATV